MLDRYFAGRSTAASAVDDIISSGRSPAVDFVMSASRCAVELFGPAAMDHLITEEEAAQASERRYAIHACLCSSDSCVSAISKL